MNTNSTKIKPNVVFIFSDQQHWRAVGFQDKFFDTPNLDVLARESIVFENAFCTTPQCSPSRSSIMTGLYPSKTGVMGNIGAAGGNPLHHKTIGAILQENGYYTGYVGKWHLGNNKNGMAGWNEAKGIPEWEGITKEYSYKLSPNPEIKEWDKTSQAAGFLAKMKDRQKPFALFVSYVNPHDIYDFRKHDFAPELEEIPLPESWNKENFEGKPKVQKQFMLKDQGKAIWGKPRREWERYRDCYREQNRLYDANVGTLIKELKKHGFWNNTILIVTSDHGDMDTNHRLIFKGPFMYEYMVRIPLMIRIPVQLGGIEPCRISDIDTANVDLLPTILDLCDIEPIESDGISLKSVLTGTKGQKRRDFVIGEYYSKQLWVNPIRMIRTTSFKYNKYIYHGEELYDLKIDSNELNNLANDAGYAKVKAELSAELNKWIEENSDSFYSLYTTTRTGERMNFENKEVK